MKKTFEIQENAYKNLLRAASENDRTATGQLNYILKQLYVPEQTPQVLPGQKIYNDKGTSYEFVCFVEGGIKCISMGIERIMKFCEFDFFIDKNLSTSLLKP